MNSKVVHSSQVVVTGANGHLGYNIVKQLVDLGYVVRATVRSTKDDKKTAQLKSLGVELVEANLLDKESLISAFQGMDGIFQVAAGFKLHAKNPELEILKPALEGTQNVLEAASECNVKKIIYTSSVAAVGSSFNGEKKNERDWNDNSHEFYAKCKNDAERLLWLKAQEMNLNVVTILPGMIIGPNFSKHTPSTYLFDKILNENMPMILPVEFAITDVRDVANAHIKAYENGHSEGRYIAAGSPVKMQDVLAIIAKIRPELSLPKSLVPPYLYPLLPFFDKVESFLFGRMRTLTKGVMQEYLDGSAQNFDTSKIQKDLNWTRISTSQTIEDTLNWIEKNKVSLE
ncbi:NAD-dependent epimerase/dehydratase family protein [Alteromonas sp. 5E99-2]|uniref:NAD-dependent epimerase/dehydratase family protein n=1 Tax=Alteromonas sp. 5E99-2 TaxID=2817683 RepID=UPI001A980598|nr:NAD-dependent epimerase/dehydratase family protein [Alteromonas sp. 5E99-2]MBO1257025.1 NAD-dependent epimerase/dehydratase family protein [Alteromonas sp. 5E99-2]